MHHVRYRLPNGLDGLAAAMGAVMAAIRPIVRELEHADGQRLVLIQDVRPGKRHTSVDPSIDPPPYWPTRGRRSREPGR